MEIRKLGNLYQLRSEQLGTVYQSHKLDEVKQFARENNCLYSINLGFSDIGKRRYGRLINW